MLLNRIVIVLITINSGVCRKESLFVDLFQRGKSFFSRSSEFRESGGESVSNSPEHRDGHYYGIELFDKPVSTQDNREEEENQNQYQITKQQDHGDKDKGNYKLIYHTHVKENDNMDLYQLLGGLSFASLLATTIFILGRNRRNGSLTKSFEEISRNRGRRDALNTALSSIYPSAEEILARLLSSQFTLSLQKTSARKGEGHA